MTCPNCKDMLDAILAVDEYFQALRDQWDRNEGRLVTESGVIALEGSERAADLCDIAGRKVGIIANRYRRENKT